MLILSLELTKDLALDSSKVRSGRDVGGVLVMLVCSAQCHVPNVQTELSPVWAEAWVIEAVKPCSRALVAD